MESPETMSKLQGRDSPHEAPTKKTRRSNNSQGAPAEPPAKKSRRRPNFSEEEVIALVNEVSNRREVILGRLDTLVTSEAKDSAWEEVTVAVNNVSQVTRVTDEVRKKFRVFRSEVKRKAAKIRKQMRNSDGSEPVDRYRPSEEAILTLLKQAAQEGIQVRITRDNPFGDEENFDESGESPPPSPEVVLTEHPHSFPSSPNQSCCRHHSTTDYRKRTAVLADMLQVQKDIRDALYGMNDALHSIAQSLQDLTAAKTNS